MFLFRRRPDLTKVIERLDAIEGSMSATKRGLVFALKDSLTNNLYALANAKVGDRGTDDTGDVVWSDDMAAAMAKDNDDMRAIVAELES